MSEVHAEDCDLDDDCSCKAAVDWRDVAAELTAALFVDDEATRIKAMKMYAKAVLLEHRAGRG